MTSPPSLLEFFTTVAGPLGRLTEWLINRRDRNRDRVATYFDQVADCLREIAERIDAGEAPRDTCQRLAVYAAELERVIGPRGYLAATTDPSVEETTRRLGDSLSTAHARWGAQSQVGIDDVIVDRTVAEIESRARSDLGSRDVWEAAGEFRAMADALRAR